MEAEAGHALRLRAADVEDLKVIAAVTQDALVAIDEMSFLVEEKRFVVALNRFCWERDHEAPPFERIHSGLSIENVTQVQTRNIDPRQHGQVLDLLTIRYQDEAVVLSFAGHRDVRLVVTGLACRLDDFGLPWPTKTQPRHEDAAQGWMEWDQTTRKA